jgi:hypothetical protein
MLFNVPLVTTAEYLTHAQHMLVLSTIWMGLALLASAAISMVVAVAALIWHARDPGSYRAKPGSRDPWSYDHQEPAIRAAEREGVNRIYAGER